MTTKPDDLDSLFNLIGQPVPEDLTITPRTLSPANSPSSSTHVCETCNGKGRLRCPDCDGREAGPTGYTSLSLSPGELEWLHQTLAMLRLDWFVQQRNLKALRRGGETLSQTSTDMLDSLTRDIEASQPIEQRLAKLRKVRS